MKRKFTNVFLLVAIGIAALTSFVSCKDYEDDLRTQSDIQSEIIKDDLQQQLDALQRQLDDAIEKLDGINSCECDPELRQKIYDYIKEYCKDYRDETQIKEMIDAALSSAATTDQLTQLINNAVHNAVTTKEIVNELFESFEKYEYSFINMVNLDTLAYYVMRNELSNYVTQEQLENYVTKEQLENELEKYTTTEEMNAIIDAVKDSLSHYVTYEEYTLKVLEINDSINSLRTQTALAQQTANDALLSAQNAAKLAQAAQDSAKAAQDTANVAKKLAESLNTQVQTLTGTVNTLNQTVQTLSQDVLKLQTRVEEVADTARTAYLDAKKALSDVDALRNEYLAAKDSIAGKMTEHFDSLNNRCAVLHDSIEAVLDSARLYYRWSQDALKQVQNQLDYRIDSLGIDTRWRINNVQERVAKVEELMDKVEGRVTLNELKIDTLKNRVEAAENAIEGLTERMDSVENKVGALEDKLSTLKKNVDALKARVDDLSDRLNRLITGIVIQGVHNPVFGNITTPWGSETNVLATYYGKAINSIDEFPTSTHDYYYYLPAWDRERVYLDDEDVAIYNNGDNSFTFEDEDGWMYENKEGNAGTLYLTVNSAAKQDFSGAQFELVNTQDKPAYVTLGTLEKENDWVKYFGYNTRAVEDNQLYRAKATITTDFAKAAPKINLSQKDVKDVLKGIKDNHRPDFSKIASMAYKAVRSDVLPAYGVKAPWNDSEGAHAVYSSYNIAATAIKPLSFSFLNDITPEYVPGLSQVENFVASMIDGIKFDMPHFNIDNLQAPTITKIELLELTDDLLAQFKVAVDIDTTIVLRLDTLITPPNITLDPITVDIQKYIKTITDTIKGQTITFKEFPVWVKSPEVNIGEIRVPKGDGTGDYLIADPPTVEIEDSVKVWVQVPNQEIGDIVLELHPEVDAVVINPEVHVDDFHLKITKGMKIWVRKEIDMSGAVVEFYNKVKKPIEDVNQMISDINNFLDDVNDALQELKKVNTITQQVDDAKNDIKDKLIGYLEKAADKILPYLTPSIYLQPILLVEGSNDFGILTQNVKTAYQAGGRTLTLIPTTANAELLTPSFKKWIAVTDVYTLDRKAHAKGKNGNQTCKNVRDAVNKNNAELNEVINGSIRRIDVTFQPGYIYEISYQAMDYSGLVSARKYYLKVK